MTAAGERAGLVAFFGLAAERCLEAVGPDADIAAVRRHLVPALAVLRSLARHTDLGDTDLQLARVAASDAAASCRTHPPTDELAAVVAGLEDVVLAADAALGQEPVLEPAWERFLFADVDVEIRRDAHGWVARAEHRLAHHTFLDAALEAVLAVSEFRIAQLTVQILDWIEHGAPYGVGD